eukprot:CAMPEP_0206149942 /NCGR_PEP_ID=MMETSP1473-20131121/38042_1 /ASSEMBLY_ACC=CAM_ASM_001109 /TAXON_ID=1461547 /ORGANISM="Stichococcus sp, Strain RCC1054" /LENGTH=186 /DNA_ID=CAMNT_0053547427 /DNA_START=733 /DNA_END=1293 /DNA_ORIENTATION=-
MSDTFPDDIPQLVYNEPPPPPPPFSPTYSEKLTVAQKIYANVNICWVLAALVPLFTLIGCMIWLYVSKKQTRKLEHKDQALRAAQAGHSIEGKPTNEMPSNYLFPTLSDEPVDSLLPPHKTTTDSTLSSTTLLSASSDVQNVLYESDVEIPTRPLSVMQSPIASSDRIKLLQMTATRRGIAAGMRL